MTIGYGHLYLPAMTNPERFQQYVCGLLILCVVLLSASSALAANGRKQVLYVNSYQNGYAWSDNILSGIRETFRESDLIIDLQVEYMDAKKYPAAENRAILKRLFASKFSATRFDAILSSDNDAYQFLLEYRDELFPSVPVVFCGVNYLKQDELAEHRDFTGVVERLDIRGSLGLALELSPEKKRIVVVGDSSLTSNAIVAQIKAAMPDFQGRLEFLFWHNLPLNELLDRSRSLSDDTLLFYIPVYAETGGKYLSAGEVVEALYENASVPVYGVWSFLLGHGIVGGRLLDGYSQGSTAASMVVDILKGRTVADIPVVAGGTSPLMFDWRVLDKFDLLGKTPDGALFINSPEPTYKLEKRIVWTVVILFSVLAIFTIMLGASRNRAVRAERELALSRKTLRSIIDTIPQLIYWKDLRSRYVGVNQRFADFFGLSGVAEAEGKSNRDILKGGAFAETGEKMDQDVLHDSVPRLREVIEYDGPDHKGTMFEVSKIPLHDDDGEIVGVLSTAEDISVRVDLERQLIQSQKMEAVGTFVGGIAHDFNNLLTTIINSAELALMDIEGSEAGDDVLRAKLAAEHGSQLVSQILTYARPSNKGAVHMDAVATVNEALNLVEAVLPESVRLNRNVPDDALDGVADPSQLQQVIMNLCTNSVHALRPTGGELTVSLSVEQGVVAAADDADPGRVLRLQIGDDGPGIPAEVVDRVFDPFYTTKDKNEGTGLGLAIVQGIIHGHGGQVRLTSHPGRTLFDIVIPFEGGEAVLVGECETDCRGREHILFVDDDADQLAVIPRALEYLGYRVTPVNGGRAALESLTVGSRFDVVVTDFDMPGIDGVELTRTLHQLYPGVPVILVSGGQDAAAVAKGESGIAKILLKPYTGASLAGSIRKVLDGREENQT